jgi:hypothetical protein
MSTSWQTVSVFIRRTFNDMHAERDYLVKRVFPELREWCKKWKFSLGKYRPLRGSDREEYRWIRLRTDYIK